MRFKILHNVLILLRLFSTKYSAWRRNRECVTDDFKVPNIQRGWMSFYIPDTQEGVFSNVL